MREKPSAPALSHLDPPALQRLMESYYAGDDLDALIAEFRITCSPISIWRHFPPEITDQVCSVCAAPTVRPKPSRSKAKSNATVPLHCTSCRHEERPGCQCESCRKVRRLAAQAEIQREYESVVDFCNSRWSYSLVQVSPEHLSAEAAVALLSLIRCGGWLDETTIGPLCGSALPFSPKNAPLRAELINSLLLSDLIAPSPHSKPGTFKLVHAEERVWDDDAVHWMLRMPDATKFAKQLELLAAANIKPDGWDAGLRDMWRRLADAECLEYCAYSLSQRNLPMPAGVALSALIDNLLRDFPVSKCYLFIWNGAKDAADFRVRTLCSARHASNYFIGACQRRADRARTDGGPTYEYRRNFNLPRSQISHVLHDVFLRHGELGFTGVIPQN